MSNAQFIPPYTVLENALKFFKLPMNELLEEIFIKLMYTNTDCCSHTIVFFSSSYSRYYIFKDAEWLYSVDYFYGNATWNADLANKKIEITSKAIEKYNLSEDEDGGDAYISQHLYSGAGTSL